MIRYAATKFHNFQPLTLTAPHSAYTFFDRPFRFVIHQAEREVFVLHSTGFGRILWNLENCALRRHQIPQIPFNPLASTEAILFVR
jgi:hypothetical protein